MKPLRHHWLPIETYFEIELGNETRFEYWEGAIIAMAGASPSHNHVAVKTVSALDARRWTTRSPS